MCYAVRRRRGRWHRTDSFCTIPWIRHREAVSLQQGGRWSCGAREGFDLRPPTDSYCNNLKPKILQRANNKLLGFHPVLLQCLSWRLQPHLISISLSHYLLRLSVWISFSFLELSKVSASSFPPYSAFSILSDLSSLSLLVSQTFFF